MVSLIEQAVRKVHTGYAVWDGLNIYYNSACPITLMRRNNPAMEKKPTLHVEGGV